MGPKNLGGMSSDHTQHIANFYDWLNRRCGWRAKSIWNVEPSDMRCQCLSYKSWDALAVDYIRDLREGTPI